MLQHNSIRTQWQSVTSSTMGLGTVYLKRKTYYKHVHCCCKFMIMRFEMHNSSIHFSCTLFMHTFHAFYLYLIIGSSSFPDADDTISPDALIPRLWETNARYIANTPNTVTSSKFV